MKDKVTRPTGRARAAAFLLVMAGSVGCSSAKEPGTRLAALPVDAGTVTVSGISAGGYMAVQFHVAHSALVRGAGVVAAGPYFCAENSLHLALGRCMKGGEDIPAARLVEVTSRLAIDGAIDPIAGLADDRVWIFHGAADPVVQTTVVDALEAYYKSLVDPTGLARQEHPQAGHVFPSRGAGLSACGVTEPPFVGDCGMDGARTLLEHLYGPLRDGRPPQVGELVEFDQLPYASLAGSAALAERGWLYVPAGCAAGSTAKCRLHVVFHGCKQGGSYVGDQFIRRSGYLEAAAANETVVLFPQVAPSYQPLNPNGCWDWWGYEGETYAVKAGPQMRAVRRMIGDLIGEPAS